MIFSPNGTLGGRFVEIRFFKCQKGTYCKRAPRGPGSVNNDSSSFLSTHVAGSYQSEKDNVKQPPDVF